MKFIRYFTLLFLTLLSFENFATHIVGGEIYFEVLPQAQPTWYRVTLKLYRDCYNGVALYDNPATIFIFNNAGSFIDSVEIPFPGSAVLPVSINNPCFTPPGNVCVEEAVYQTDVFLPPIPGGYNITYQRCCRNSSVLNLNGSGNVGSTYMAHIPDPVLAPNNSSPHFNNFPPIFLCSGGPLNFDHSAYDRDGDSLYYELCDPFTGLSSSCPILGASAGFGCPVLASPPPYPFVPWLAPYNAAYPMSASPAITINPFTGLITGTPNMIGQWVVGVCVSEYRNGVFLDANKRDFQFNVANCPNLPVASIPQQTLFCFGYLVNFTQNSLNAFTYHWDFGDPTISQDTSNVMAPTWTYADSGTYSVTLTINPGTMCADTQINTFFIYPLLDPDLVPPSGECIENNSFGFTASGDYMGNGTFLWNFGSAASPSTSNQINPTNIVYSAAGVFPVTLTISENGCTKSRTDSVHVYPKPDAHFNFASTMGCTLSPVRFTDSSIADTPLSYSWNFGNGSGSTYQNPVTEYASPGNYNVTLIITNQHGCKDTAILLSPIIILASPVAGFSVTPNDTSVYAIVTMTDQSQFATNCFVSWGDGYSSTNCDSTHQYSNIGTYSIMQVVVNSMGCRDTAYSEVIIHSEFSFWMPNAFTPDGDGINDVFKPKLKGIKNYKFLVFNRWGEKLFETSDLVEGWNGYYHSRPCEQDVYVYKVIFRDDEQQALHQYIGTATLVR